MTLWSAIVEDIQIIFDGFACIADEIIFIVKSAMKNKGKGH